MTIDRRTKWQQKQIAAGNCRQCGQRRDGPYTTTCKKCAKRSREHNRLWFGGEPWKPGGKGRPPLERE